MDWLAGMSPPGDGADGGMTHASVRHANGTA
jgi:hypothetical protein